MADLEVRNLGHPIKLTGIKLLGVSARAARGGEQVDIYPSLGLTSDQALFHKIIGGLVSAIEHCARPDVFNGRLDRASTVFVVQHPDETGELWVDTAAMCVYSTIKRPEIVAGGVIFESDVADVTGVWFPRVTVAPEDRILCIIREGWRFALYFDFRPEGILSVEDATREIGTLYRRMRYADLYAAVETAPTFTGLVSAGWFPFLELIGGEFRTLLAAQENNFGFAEAEHKLIEAFDEKRLDGMFDRWMTKPQLKQKETILSPAIKAFKLKEPVTTIKIVLSEIEGVMSDACFEISGERTHRIPKLLTFIIARAEEQAGGKDTLFFPVEFGRYLQDYTYRGFTAGGKGSGGSRNAVAHGAVAAEEYTMARALQALLTLDQLAFYL